jgi:methylated-DNA-[protein]-cysteine S-methyltransferase
VYLASHVGAGRGDGDLGLLKAARRHRPDTTARALARWAERWRPWRGYAATHLWATLDGGRDGRGRMTLGLATISSPIGTIELVFDAEALLALDFEDHGASTRTWLARRFGAIQLAPATDGLGVARSLRRYFTGDLHALDDIPTRAGGTPFQERVWSALRRIPVGHTTTYGALAAELGRPSAQRAVGAANGANPISIVVPCHRVIGHGGRLTGYGGGLDRKRWLLRHEGAVLC